jgi:polysaccharide export outer membrane protein
VMGAIRAYLFKDFAEKLRNLITLTLVFFLGGLMLTPVFGPRLSLITVEAQAAVAKEVEDNYRLGPEDELEISVWKEPELTKKLSIRPDGKLSYPLIGEIQAAGKTVKQLREEISKRLEKFVTDAQVTVLLSKTQHYKIYVTGKVNKPGEFNLGQPTNVLQALAMAGGLTPYAKSRNIVILRRSGGMTLPFDYKAVSQGQFLDQNRVLLPGDVVVVP